MPVFTLVDQEGRLFKPLAYAKNFAMAIAALLAMTLDPAVRMMFTRMDFVHFKPAWLSNLVNTRHGRTLLPRRKTSDQQTAFPDL